MVGGGWDVGQWGGGEVGRVVTALWVTSQVSVESDYPDIPTHTPILCAQTGPASHRTL